MNLAASSTGMYSSGLVCSQSVSRRRRPGISVLLGGVKWAPGTFIMPVRYSPGRSSILSSRSLCTCLMVSRVTRVLFWTVSLR